jgi:hypothetical protein
MQTHGTGIPLTEARCLSAAGVIIGPAPLQKYDCADGNPFHASGANIMGDGFNMRGPVQAMQWRSLVIV